MDTTLLTTDVTRTQQPSARAGTLATGIAEDEDIFWNVTSRIGLCNKCSNNVRL